MNHTQKKVILLLLCLGLCLFLTGCYIAPDDISNDGGYQTSGGNLPFQTLAPTATVEVTPDTVVIVTQNLFGNGGTDIAVTNSGIWETPAVEQRPTPTPTPTMPAGSVGWSDWGTVSGTTATPPPGVSVSVLPDGTPESSTMVLTQ